MSLLNTVSLKTLDALLGELSDSAEARGAARRELIAAVNAYHEHPDPEVAKTREALSKFCKVLSRATDHAIALPYQARVLFARECGASGKVQTTLLAAAAAAERATRIADDLPNKQPNYERVLLAYDVARILKDQLSIPPRLTRDDLQSRPGARGGSAYARLLRQTLELAGVHEIDDLWPDMGHGLELLREIRRERAQT